METNNRFEDIFFYFVIPTKTIGGNLQDVLTAYDNLGRQCRYKLKVKPSYCFNHDPEYNEVFVLGEFENRTFEELKRKCGRIVNAKFLSKLIEENKSVLPCSRHPIHSEGMKGLTVAVSGFDPQSCDKIKKKVEYMGGKCYIGFRYSSHVIVQNILTKQALRALDLNKPVMVEDWINEIWERSCRSDAHGEDAYFHKFKAPVFYNLSITSSGLTKREKDSMKQLIHNNGGIFYTNINKKTDILIAWAAKCKKFKYAVRYGIPCIVPTWVISCVNMGRILDYRIYTVTDETSSFNSTDLSQDLTDCKSETCMPITNKISSVDEISNQEDLSLPTSNDEMTSISWNEVKNAGKFLTDLNILLSGFNESDMEQLVKVLNLAGATVFKEMCSYTTHIIVGLNSPYKGPTYNNSGIFVVTVEWLVQSIKLKKPAPEEKYTFQDILPINDETRSTRYEVIKKKFTSLKRSQDSKDVKNIFQGIRFVISDEFNTVTQLELFKLILKGGGVVKEECDNGNNLTIVPIEGGLLQYTCDQLVTKFFIQDCVNHKKIIVPTKYYHFPHKINKNEKPLKGCIIQVDQYDAVEREFLENLIILLGASLHGQMNTPTFTHLICSKAVGDKYKTAILMKIPIINHGWLLDCLLKQTKISETQYLVFDSQNETSYSPNVESLVSSEKCEERFLDKFKFLYTSKNFNEKNFSRLETNRLDRSNISMIIGRITIDVKSSKKTSLATHSNNHETEKTQIEIKVFMVCGFVSNKTEIEHLIRESGGVISRKVNTGTFDVDVTHVICNDLCPVQEVMMSICAGALFLHPDYLKTLSVRKNVFMIKEEEYEWGNPMFNDRLQNSSIQFRELVESAYYWRLLKQDKLFPFKDLTCSLQVDIYKYDFFKCLIEVGGGTITNYHSTNLCLCDADFISWNKRSLTPNKIYLSVNILTDTLLGLLNLYKDAYNLRK